MTNQWYTNAAMDTRAGAVAPPTIRELGHVSLFVRDLEATRAFYRDTLGLRETGTSKGGRIVFFSAGRHHHDVSCELARADGPGPQPKGVPGLYHIAFDVGGSLEDLAAARAWCVARGHAPFGEGETYFCVRDPDGHEIELYVDLVGSARTRQMATTPATSASTASPNAGT
jgi:catechol 2,3-dioxygenase